MSDPGGQPQPGVILRQIRTERNLSLEQVAVMTGVSRPMLSQIERGSSTPTVTTLWKLASGLKVPLSRLTRPAAVSMCRALQQEPLEEEQGRMKAWLLFPFDPDNGTEVWRVCLEAGCVHSSQAHAPGTREYILMESGDLTMTLGSHAETLSRQDALQFGADTAHQYATADGCSFYNVITYQ
ncbi:helix-turn-helix domain-containing protein [uncultured Faecalibaculum sp.]|uniref:helix-turn-helix domain-containing protein n=1 Tax=uncultured Faecalibaculum sp. TaxID=1729681 RepID=UPI002610B993|nr:XRE family transcriptional regulator [uncultured Faecalibaculum sp.]